MTRLVTDALIRFNRSNVDILPTFNRFNKAWHGLVERNYLRWHGALPGSDRTSRLRKKRRKIVMEWLEGWVEDAN